MYLIFSTKFLQFLFWIQAMQAVVKFLINEAYITKLSLLLASES
jgi:hypothetical protein